MAYLPFQSYPAYLLTFRNNGQLQAGGAALPNGLLPNGMVPNGMVPRAPRNVPVRNVFAGLQGLPLPTAAQLAAVRTAVRANMALPSPAGPPRPAKRRFTGTCQ